MQMAQAMKLENCGESEKMPNIQTSKTNLLIVEDQASMRQMLEDFLQPLGFNVTSCPSADDACSLLFPSETADESFEFSNRPAGNGSRKANTGSSSSPFDIVLTDVKMPGMNGLEFCRIVKDHFPQMPVIVMTAYGSLETAVEALRAGAFDFATKPIELELLKACLVRAAEHSQLRRRVRDLESQIGSLPNFPKLIGQSESITQLKEQLAKIVDSSASVLLSGESGSGKEVVARALHEQSERADQPFLAVNCSALPEALFESELFGHVKGAFTDAKTDREGLFRQANGGTLFLDEIGEMPIALQPKLLRALEERSVRPLGGKSNHSFDVRVIAATNRDLETAIEEKRFRQDLYYRINVLELSVPPLRSRGADVLLLVNHFLKHFAQDQEIQFEESALQKMMAYDWPGNVRELKNVIQRAVLLASDKWIGVDSLPTKIVEHNPNQLVIADQDSASMATLETIQLRYIRYVLEQCGGNKSEAANVLGLDRKTLYRKLKENSRDAGGA